MNSLIIVTPAHQGKPVICRLGETQVILTSDFDTPDAFEMATPPYIPDEALSDVPETEQPISIADQSVVAPEDVPPPNATIIMNDSESFGLYQCLYTLYGLKRLMNPDGN